MFDFLNKAASHVLGVTPGINNVANILSSKLESAPVEVYKAPEAPKIPNVRGVDVDKETFDSVFKPILFGEVSNRDASKKELEARVLLNTALNRVPEHNKRGKNMTLKDVLTQPNQYQAYGGNQYNLYTQNKLDAVGMKKKEEVDSIADKLWQEIQTGKFDDTTEGAYYYIHNPDQSITYDNKKQLYAK